MESLIIFLVWLAIVVVGVVVSAKKKARQQNAPSQGTTTRRQRWEEEIERRINDFQQQLKETQTATEPVAVEESLESEPAEPVSKPQPADAKANPAPAAAAQAKEKDLDFDPVEMVIYSEVMEPGYEKY
ncbi:MAG: hypothetical protein IKX71_04080 [Bacteroidales bacterium]|nr:hypothetical protein [Bacteroidales bacterium]